MERLKTARKPIRALLTRTCNDIETLLNPEFFDEVQLTAKDGKLDDLLLKVQTMDQQILDLYLEENNVKGYEDEMMAMDVYTSEVRLAKAKINKFFRNIEAANRKERPHSEYSTVVSGEYKQKRKFKLPKIELLKFSGKLIDWLSWWSQFEKIHLDDELHTTDKFEYLRQAMDKNTRAKDIVDGYPATEDNYPKVIKALKGRFGKKKLLIQVYVRELFQMGLQNLNKEVQIIEFFDKLVSHVRALETLGVTLEQSALFLYPMVESSLPEDVHIAWQRCPLYEKDGSMEDPPMNELDYLFEFLQQEVERGEQRQLLKTSFSSKEPSKKDNKKEKVPSTATAASLFNGQVKSICCIFCDKSHESKDCATTEFWSTDDMKKKIQEKKVCFQCLKQNHTAKTCKSFVKCHVCSKRHLTIMCPEIKEKKSKKATNSSAGSNFDCSHDVLLKTIMVSVMVNSKKKLARVLFDDGSQRSYVTTSLIKSLDSKPFRQEGMRNILFDGSRTEYQKLNNHKISVQSLTGTGTMSLIVREKSILGGRVSRVPKGFWLEEFINKKIKFNDVASNEESLSAEVDIVIGSDYWGSVVNGNKETLPCGLTAFETIWGWTLCGIIPNDNQSNNIISMFIAEEEVNKLWSLDVIGIKDPIEKMTEIQEEMAVMEMFKKTVKRNEDGRYVVKLPWVNELPKIPNNKRVAMARLMSATRKLNFNNQYKTYDDIFNDWSIEGIIEKVDIVDKEHGHYLPHRPVFKDSVTTPVRPVFDASCKTDINISLNDCMHKGPNFIDSLPAKLMRFRMKLVGVLSDIRKAFLMIEVDEKDREYLQFLWWEDDTQKKMVVLRHCRVVFGLKCSPFLLAAVLEEHLSSIPNSKKETVDELKKALYIDNCVTSLDSTEQYERFKKTAVKIMAEGKIELRQWEYSTPPKSEDISVPMETKVLGLIWDKGMDTLRIQTPKLEEFDKLTKRNIASALHKFFDPLGMVSPALISPKIMLQQAWKHKVSWDSELPAAWKEQFNKWCAEASLLNEIKIPRLCTIPNSSHQLHTFTDASQNAYSAVVFLRSEHQGEIRIQLIQSKSRVSPLAKATIPRLELMGCLVGSRLAQHSMDAMELEELEKYYWSDSTTAIAWIQRNAQWGTFVYNRVKRIRETTELSQWRYVPGKLNPADLPSRGCTPKELLLSRWWEGPTWLQLPKEKWPNNKMEFDEEEVNSEMKGKATTSMFSIDEDKSWFDPKFSKLSAKIRVMAWMLRFLHNSKNANSKRKEKHLTIPELREAEKAIIRIIQQEVELSVREKKQIKKTMSSTIIMDDGLIRLKTPITRRTDTDEFRYPYLLPHKHPLVRELIMEAHIFYCHAGAQFLMSKLREKFWITQSRKTISNVKHHCTRCKRFDTKRMEVIPAALPEKRVKSGEIFDSTGVDLFGHLTLKNGSKVWVVLYTCAVYRAIHLDIVRSISTVVFVKPLRKCVHQYGRPYDMLSDNGTNFTGTANLLNIIDKEKLEKEYNVQKIRWNFNPPAAPWWGGFFERLVRLVKEPLRKMLGQSVVNFEQLELLLMEISWIINNRPLTTLTEDPDDLEPLTPSMFLRGTKNATFPEGAEISSKMLQKEWRQIQDFKERIQSRFRREYLGQLVEHKKTNKSSLSSVGDIVLVENDKKKRYQWPMGRVLEVIISPDGETRIVKVKIKTGCINRPLRRLYPLEMSQSSSRPETEVEPKNNQLEPIISVHNEVSSEEEEEMDGTIRTRSGRKVKRPARYANWSY